MAVFINIMVFTILATSSDISPRVSLGMVHTPHWHHCVFIQKKQKNFMNTREVNCCIQIRPPPNLLLWADPIGDQPEVPIWRNEGKNSFWFPALESNARMKANVVQQPWVLWAAKESKFFPCSNAKNILVPGNYFPRCSFIWHKGNLCPPKARCNMQLNYTS